MVAIIVLSVLLAFLLIVFLWFYLYSRTLAWGQSETRRAFLRMMVVIGPIFGVRYKEPRPEPPSIATPARDQEPPVTGLVLPPEEAQPPNGTASRQ
jgi:hypothetical protein